MATQEERVRRNELLRESLTLYEQEECEVACAKYLMDFEGIRDEQAARMESAGMLDDRRRPRLMRERHVAYLMKGLGGLGGSYVALDASRPWLCYWILHGMDLLDALPEEKIDDCVATLAKCRSPTGGYGGGPQQLAHCAPTYAASLAIAVLGTRRAYESVDRKGLYAFLLSMKDPSGGFRMHDDGEVDVRGTYTALAVAALFNVLTPELAEGAAAYALRCQTYEGGFGGEPGVEAHGGYVFCALAALVILNATDAVDLGAGAVYPEGGLRDKPGKNRDYYHTCDCLSGLAASQRLYGDDASTVVYGDPGNLLHETHPVFNVRVDKVARAAAFFAGLPHTPAELTSA
ncbi:prenyltransferase [Aureococcus anophagefferens]|nr:prenyltransferase [Aureococcus anophagefferens]